MPDEISADVVVIGSGVCGCMAAHRLAKQGTAVLILEAGPRMDRGRIVANYRNSPFKGNWTGPYPASAWAPTPDLSAGQQLSRASRPLSVSRGICSHRRRHEWHWAAHAWRVVPNDLKIKSLYGVGRDWPMTYDELEPHYYEAEVKLGVSGAPDTGSPRQKPFPMEPVAEPWAMRRFRERLAPGGYDVVSNTTARNSRTFDGRPACCGNNNCQPICPIAAQFDGGVAVATAEAAGVKIVANAVVYRIEHDPKGRIAAVHYYDPNKSSTRVSGKIFILAANGIESPKLLLMSASDKFPNGVANSSGTVGRNLMDHPSSSLTFDADEELWLGRGPQSPSSINTFRDGAFRSERAAFRLDFTNISQVRTAAEDLIKAGVYGPELDRQLRYRAARQVNVKDGIQGIMAAERFRYRKKCFACCGRVASRGKRCWNESRR